MQQDQTFYITRSVPLHEFCFFIEKPTMLMLRNGNILWTDAEFACKIYGVHLVLPMLDVPVGRCWEIKIEDRADTSYGAFLVRIVDKNVDFDKHVR